MNTPTTRPPASRGGVRTVHRAIDVLLALGDASRPVGPSEISAKTGIDKATVYRLLQTLVTRDFARAIDGEGRYVLGLGLVRLGGVVLGGVDLREVSLEPMRRLRDLFNETVALSIFSNGQRVHLQQVESTHAVRWMVEVGQAGPLYAGAAGRAIYAHLPEAERKVLGAAMHFRKLGPRAPSSAAELERQVEGIRKAGVAIATNEISSSATGVAAPIFDRTGRPVAALTVCGPDSRFQKENVTRSIPALLKTAAEISAVLGYRPGAARRAS